MKRRSIFGIASLVAFALCYATILLGGNVMASDSGLACPDWPTCHGTFLPALNGPTGIEYAHRLAAGFLSLSVLFLTLAALRFERARPVLQRLSAAALGLVVAQALLGEVVVASELTVAIVLLHFFLATILFGLLLLLAALGNLREVPKRWITWAWHASEGSEMPRPDPTAVPFDRPGPVPGGSPDP